MRSNVLILPWLGLNRYSAEPAVIRPSIWVVSGLLAENPDSPIPVEARRQNAELLLGIHQIFLDKKLGLLSGCIASFVALCEAQTARFIDEAIPRKDKYEFEGGSAMLDLSSAMELVIELAPSFAQQLRRAGVGSALSRFVQEAPRMGKKRFAKLEKCFDGWLALLAMIETSDSSSEDAADDNTIPLDNMNLD